MVLCVIYLLIPFLKCPSTQREEWWRPQKALQPVSSLALSSMRSPSDPFGHVKMLPSVHMGGAGVLPERLFTFSFNINHSY